MCLNWFPTTRVCLSEKGTSCTSQLWEGAEGSGHPGCIATAARDDENPHPDTGHAGKGFKSSSHAFTWRAEGSW